MLWVLIAVVRPFLDGLQPHDVHQATNTVSSGIEPRLSKISQALATAEERVFREHPINLMHTLKRLSIHASWCVIDR